MTVQLIRKVRDRQPSRSLPINWSSPLAEGLESVFIGSEATANYLGVQWVRTGSPQRRVGPDGVGEVFSYSHAQYYALKDSNAGTGNWTIAGIFTPVSAMSNNFAPAGVAESIGVAPNDRSISISGDKWAGFLYDGTPKYAISNKGPQVGVPDIVIVTADGATLTCSVSGYADASTGISNNGYTGYSNAKFILGDASSGAGSAPVSMPLVIRSRVAWDDKKRALFKANPWQIFEPETIPLFYSTVTAQYARPTSDVSTGTWTASTGSDLFAMLDETTASDADYIVTTGASTCEVALGSLSDPSSSSGHVVRYRISADSGGITVRLRQGATTIATWTHATAPTSLTTYAQTLTSGEADSITDYTALRLQFEAT